MAKVISIFKPTGAGGGTGKKPGPGPSFGAKVRALGTGAAIGPAVNERKKMLQGKHAKMVKRLEAPIVRDRDPSSPAARLGR